MSFLVFYVFSAHYSPHPFFPLPHSFAGFLLSVPTLNLSFIFSASFLLALVWDLHTDYAGIGLGFAY